MSINQAYDRLYSDKVSNFCFLGRFPTLLDPYWQRLLKDFRSSEVAVTCHTFLHWDILIVK